MKNILRSTLAAATLSLALVTVSHAADSESGYIDMGQFAPTKEPETAALLGNLKRVRVNVVTLDDKNRAGMVERIEAIRHKLANEGWTQIVTVREKEGGDNVDIHVKQNADESIDGLVVTVIDKKGEAVFVNIVGNIKAEQLGLIADKFNIDPLRKVHAQLEPKAKDV